MTGNISPMGIDKYRKKIVMCKYAEKYIIKNSMPQDKSKTLTHPRLCSLVRDVRKPWVRGNASSDNAKRGNGATHVCKCTEQPSLSIPLPSSRI
jgi:hypothetical protein